MSTYLNRTTAAGILTGVIGLVISFAGRGLIPGRVLGDPLPLALSAGQLMRSLLYFNWRAPLFNLLFTVMLGVLSALIYRVINGADTNAEDESRRAGQIAAFINVAVVALLQVDAFIVAFWYAAGGFITVVLSGWIAGKTAQLGIKQTAQKSGDAAKDQE